MPGSIVTSKTAPLVSSINRLSFGSWHVSAIFFSLCVFFIGTPSSFFAAHIFLVRIVIRVKNKSLDDGCFNETAWFPYNSWQAIYIADNFSDKLIQTCLHLSHIPILTTSKPHILFTLEYKMIPLYLKTNLGYYCHFTSNFLSTLVAFIILEAFLF